MNIKLTFELCVQKINGGGSGLCFMMHVKFIVLPLLMNISGPPIIVVIGSKKKKIKKNKMNYISNYV